MSFTLRNTMASLWTQLHASVQQPLIEVEAEARQQHDDAEFEGWLHGDPLITKNPASRYGERAPGYMTGNGLGSLEIGASDD